MSIHIIHLTGCTPSPLANYLKALGILRLVAEQKDHNARMWWENEHAVISSCLNQDEISLFLSDEYKPTPIIAPWNGGSGFYKKDNQNAIIAIRDSNSSRFEEYQNAIRCAQSIVGEDAESQPKDKQKTELISILKQNLRGLAGNWLSAVAILSDNDKPTYPAILGTGGNDGRLDFTNNFMQRLIEVLDLKKAECPATPSARKLLNLALYNTEPTAGLIDAPIGFFSPAAIGGKANASNTFDCKSQMNPWDYILMLEGTIVFSTGVVRRCNSEQLPSGSAPFAIYSQGIGYGGSVSDEKSRGEQWVPLWNSPSSLHEISELFEQGRVQLGNKTAKRPAEIARAIGRLGTARGICAFERYGYLERNGLAYLAISLGRWNVAAQAHQEVIDHAAEWLDRMAVYINSDNSSNKLKSLYQSTGDALMSVMKNASPGRWETLLIAMGKLESCIGASVAAKMPDRPPAPLRNLPPEWVTLLPNWQNSPELRLALSLANICGVRIEKEQRKKEYGKSLRGYFLPFDQNDNGSWKTMNFAKSNVEYVSHSDHFIKDAISILRRKMIQMQNGVFPITSANGLYASLHDIVSFINGSLNDDKIWALAKPLMAISDWRSVLSMEFGAAINGTLQQISKLQSVPSAKMIVSKTEIVPAIYALMRLVFPTNIIKARNKLSYTVTADPTTLNLLLANNVRAAGQSAIRRLTTSGLRPYIQTVLADRQLTQRIAASLLFPVNEYQLGELAHQLCTPTMDNN